MDRVRANQKPDMPVSTRPLSGIAVGSTTFVFDAAHLGSDVPMTISRVSDCPSSSVHMSSIYVPG